MSAVVRPVIVACCVAFSFTLPANAWAQPGGIELAGGYSFLSESELVDDYGLGWFAGGGWRTAGWLSLVAEISRHRWAQDVGFIDVEVTLRTLLAGPRVRFRGSRITPFAHLLAGASRLDVAARMVVPIDATVADTSTHGTLQVGGGLDVPIGARLSLRVGVDYWRLFKDLTLDGSRFSTGVVYRFGG